MGIIHSNDTVYDPGYFPELPLIYSIGSMANGSNHLILSDASGGTYFRSVTPALRVPFQIGDKVIVEIGGEAGAGQRGTMGVGGKVNATNPANYFQAMDVPKALVATITNISGGNDLTLNATAFTATTNARVYRDNTDGMNAELLAATTGTVITWPVGTFAQSEYVGGFLEDNITLQGQGKRVTQLYLPKGARKGGITPGGGKTGLVIQDMTIIGNAKWQGFGLADDIGSLFFVGCGVWIFNCFSCQTRRVESINVFQKAGWSEGGSNNQFIDCNMIQEEALLSYNAQWYFGGSDSVGTIINRCRFTGVYLAPAFETFRSSGTQFLDCVSRNGSFSSNSSGNWLIENPILTVTANSWISVGGFGNFTINQPFININSNIQPPDASMLLGGIIRNVSYTCQGPVGYIDDSFIFGAFVGADNPNILFDGGFFHYPIQEGTPSQLVGACGIRATGNASVPLNCVAQNITVTGFSAAFFGNIFIDGLGAAAINCTATYIIINGVLQ